MNRLSVRLFLSHLVVAVLGAATTYLAVRLLAPALFDRGMSMGGGMHGDGSLRQTFSDAVNTALLAGTLISVVTAAGAGAFAAYRLLRPLNAVRAATRRLAQGHYDEVVEAPPELELSALAADVNRLGEALGETENRRVRMLGDLAHEMRTPLTVIEGYAEGMVDGVFPASLETLSKVGHEVHRLRRLADDLSNLSRAEEGRLDLHLEKLDLTHLAVQAAERLRPQFEDAGVDLVTPEPGAVVAVRADAVRVAQVVTNLIGNSLRATPRGGRVRLDVRSEGRTASVSVSDTGVGLDQPDLERVFERFYRATTTSRPNAGAAGGSGLGLTIARGIARAHGGDVTAGSDGRGHGATFVLDLPTPAAAQGPRDGERAPSRKRS